jgi:hypothetical protein
MDAALVAIFIFMMLHFIVSFCEAQDRPDPDWAALYAEAKRKQQQKRIDARR